jgi:hypothetical protein
MLQGAWFNAANLIINGLTPSHRPSPQKPFRFVRLVSYSDPRVTDLADTRSRLIERLWLGTTFQREPTTSQPLRVFVRRVSSPLLR